jgi:CRP-like cAMP-binding protein
MSNDIVSALRGMRALEGLSHEHVDRLASIAEEVAFPAGAIIFREGDPATDVYLLMEGSVSVEICAPSVGCRRILTVAEGELLGWSPVLEQGKLTASARTQAPTLAVKINGQRLLALCDEDPRFGYEFMRRAALALAKRLSATRLQLLNLYGSEMPRTAESAGSA